MLPAAKRPKRNDDALGREGAYETRETRDARETRRSTPSPFSVGHQTLSSRRSTPPPERPRIFVPVDDEKTTVMPHKRNSSFPPASAQAPRGASRALPLPPPRGHDGEADEIFVSFSSPSVRAPAVPASAIPSIRAPREASPSSRGVRIAPPAMVPQAHMVHVSHEERFEPFEPTVLQGPARELVVSQRARVASSPDTSSAPLSSDPPPAVVTASERVIVGRPTASWAAALVAMGVFVGLIAAIIARGDGDALIDTTASLVDPAHPVSHAPAAQPPVAPVAVPAAVVPLAAPPVAVNYVARSAAPVAAVPVAEAPAQVSVPVLTAVATAPAPVLTAAAAHAAAPAPAPAAKPAPEPVRVVSANDLPVAAPAKPAPAPVRHFTPWRPPPRPAPVAAAAPAPPKPKKAPAPAAASDNDGAAEADKLAREQLEAALR